MEFQLETRGDPHDIILYRMSGSRELSLKYTPFSIHVHALNSMGIMI